MFGSHAKEQVDRDKLYSKSIKRRGSFFKRKKAFLEASQNNGVDLYNATPEQMQKIKAKIKAEKASQKSKVIKIIIASTIVGLLCFAAIFGLLRLVFF